MVGLQPELVGHLGHGLGAAVGVEPAGVGDHLDAPVEAGPHDLFHLGDERAGVAAAGALHPGAGEDQHRELGQPVAGEHVDRPALDHLLRRAQPVAVEPRAVRDPDRLGHDTARSVLVPELHATSRSNENLDDPNLAFLERHVRRADPEQEPFTLGLGGLEDEEEGAVGDLVAGGDADLGDHAVGGGGHVVLHLHGLEDHERSGRRRRSRRPRPARRARRRAWGR